MESFAKLLHKSNTSLIHTPLPVYFFGMPNGKIYILYARFYEVKFDKSDLEYVIAVHKEFVFDALQHKVTPLNPGKYSNQSSVHLFDQAEPNYKIKDVKRNIDSFKEAVLLINKRAENMMRKQGEKTVRQNKNDKRRKIINTL